MAKGLLVLAVLGAVIYVVISTLQRRGDGGLRPRLRRPVAPDDDPQFLRDLDDRLWQEKRHGHHDPDAPPDAG